MYCPSCGKLIADNETICPGCGHSFVSGNPLTSSSNNGGAKKSLAPVILGVVGIVFAFLFALVGHIASIIGIVLGFKEYRANGSVAGLVVSIIGEVLSIISSILGFLMVIGLSSYIA